MVQRLLEGIKEKFQSPLDEELVRMFLDPRLRPLLRGAIGGINYWETALTETKEKLEQLLRETTVGQQENAFLFSNVTNRDATTESSSSYHTGGSSFLVATKCSAPAATTSPVYLNNRREPYAGGFYGQHFAALNGMLSVSMLNGLCQARSSSTTACGTRLQPS